MRPIKLLLELFALAKGSKLADMVLETAAAAQEHGGATARIGANRDGSMAVYSRDPRVAQAFTGILRKAGVSCQSVEIPPVGFQQFHRLVTQPGVVQLLCEGFDGEAPVTIRTGQWPELVARSVLRDLADELAAGDDQQQGQARKVMQAIEDPMSCVSEGRFRTALNEALGWTAARLDGAVADVIRRAGGGPAAPPPGNQPPDQ
jgi:hypothetical protein